VRLVEVVNSRIFGCITRKETIIGGARRNRFVCSDLLVFEDDFFKSAQQLLSYFVPQLTSCKLNLKFKKKTLQILLKKNTTGMHNFSPTSKVLSAKVSRNSLSGDGNSDILRLFPVVGDNLPRPPIHRLHTVVEVSGLNEVT
jgi:hypothetical protein